MPTPLQESSYELLVRSTSVSFETNGDWRHEKLLEFMHEAAIQVNTAITDATTSPDRNSFLRSIGRCNTWVRRMKVLLQVLDDLGTMNTEDAHALHASAEEVQRLVMSAMRTAKAIGNQQSDRNGGLKLRL